MEDPAELIKVRHILFAHPQTQQTPAVAAAQYIEQIEGVTRTQVYADFDLEVSYDVSKVTLNMLEALLEEVGFHLDNSLFSKLKRALLHYTEDTQLANMGYEHAQSKSTVEIFINHYQQAAHGCRDKRPLFYRHL